MSQVLITGATGFVGGRLIERLATIPNIRIRVILRNFARAARIARFDLDMVRGRLTDPEAVSAAVNGCTTVFHCAHDFASPETNLAAAKTIAQACLGAKVKRLVYLSSFAAYQPFPDGIVDERSPSTSNGRAELEWRYQDNKIEIEQEFLRGFIVDGLPVVILQPTIIYGPFGGYWTNTVVQFLQTGRVLLPEDGTGLCNPVYIDDVIEAMILASEADNAAGNKILVSSGETVTWHEYYRAYERALGVNSVRIVPHDRLSQASRWTRRDRMMRALQYEPIPTIALVGAKLIAETLRPSFRGPFTNQLNKYATPWKMFLPDEQQLSMYLAHPRVSIAKAQKILKFRPIFDFERGMARTLEYLEWAAYRP